MKRLFTTLILITLFISCSSDNGGSLIEEPITTKNFYLTEHHGQMLIYKINESGTRIYDTDEGEFLVGVKTGDTIVVTCKVGELVIPSVPYNFQGFNAEGDYYETEFKRLYSSTNTTNDTGISGFRLMRTEDGAGYLVIE